MFATVQKWRINMNLVTAMIVKDATLQIWLLGDSPESINVTYATPEIAHDVLKYLVQDYNERVQQVLIRGCVETHEAEF